VVYRTLYDEREYDNIYEGLEAAAAAMEQEAMAQRRTLAEQHTKILELIQPRPIPAVQEDARPAGPMRSRAEQLARCEELAKNPSQPSAPATPTGPRPGNVADQQKRCAELAQPRVRDPSVDEPSTIAGQWRKHLLARASAAVPDEVAEAQTLLEQMRAAAAAKSRPSSAAAVAPARKQRPEVAVVPEAEAALVEELRVLVEEVLWVVLLQVRSCPKALGSQQRGTADSCAGTAASSVGATLEDRLRSHLISATGPALRPVARRIVGPGQGLARRVRAEFPRLAAHLGFRESDETEGLGAAWTQPELEAHLREVRVCRDRLLAMDITQTMISRIGQQGD